MVYSIIIYFWASLVAWLAKNPPTNTGDLGFDSWAGKIPWRRERQPTPYSGLENSGSLRRNGVAIIVNKRIQNAVLGCSLKNDRMISVHFQSKPFNITVIPVYASTSNAEEAELVQFYEDLQDLLELTPKKMSFSL